jgi:hypothetical protein
LLGNLLNHPLAAEPHELIHKIGVTSGGGEDHARILKAAYNGFCH